MAGLKVTKSCGFLSGAKSTQSLALGLSLAFLLSLCPVEGTVAPNRSDVSNCRTAVGQVPSHLRLNTEPASLLNETADRIRPPLKLSNSQAKLLKTDAATRIQVGVIVSRFISEATDPEVQTLQRLHRSASGGTERDRILVQLVKKIIDSEKRPQSPPNNSDRGATSEISPHHPLILWHLKTLRDIDQAQQRAKKDLEFLKDALR